MNRQICVLERRRVCVVGEGDGNSEGEERMGKKGGACVWNMGRKGTAADAG